MRFTTIAAAAAIAVGGLTACLPTPPPPVLLPPALCGTTLDGRTVVTTYADAPRCPAGPGQNRVVSSVPCGPTLQGSDAAGDCWRGWVAQVPGRALYGWHIMPWSSFVPAWGDQAQQFIVSDYKAAF